MPEDKQSSQRPDSDRACPEPSRRDITQQVDELLKDTELPDSKPQEEPKADIRTVPGSVRIE